MCVNEQKIANIYSIATINEFLLDKQTNRRNKYDFLHIEISCDITNKLFLCDVSINKECSKRAAFCASDLILSW
jgi:hypothetical protein